LVHVLAHARLATRANPREGGCAILNLPHPSCACGKRLMLMLLMLLMLMLL